MNPAQRVALRFAKKKRTKNVGQGGLDEWFAGHGGGDPKDRATRGDWVSISPVNKTLKMPDGKEKKIEVGDIVGPCGISGKPEWKEFTNDGKDPLKCMPRDKAYDLGKKERGELAKEKLKAEKADTNSDKSPTRTPTFTADKDKKKKAAAQDIAYAYLTSLRLAKGLTGEEKNEIYREWKKIINMSKKELEAWAEDDSRLSASLNRQEADKEGDIQSGLDSLHRIKRRVDKPKSEWSNADYTNAKQEIGFNTRMLGNDPGDLASGETLSKWHISLKNWGHDPSKSNSPAYGKHKTWARKNKSKIDKRRAELRAEKKAHVLTVTHYLS